MTEAFVHDAVRTRFGKQGGALTWSDPTTWPPTLARRWAGPPRPPNLSASTRSLGHANGAGKENRNVGRRAAVLAGLPTNIPRHDGQPASGSSLGAAIIASPQFATAEADVAVIGDVVSMSRAPCVPPKTDKPHPAGNLALTSRALSRRPLNRALPWFGTVFPGEATELLRVRHGISRQRQDEFAVCSHQLTERGWSEGFYDGLVLGVPDAGLVRDESIRPESTVERLAGLKTVFHCVDSSGSVTAGNDCPLTDGAPAAALASAHARDILGLTPLARVAGGGASALEPQHFGLAPVEATHSVLRPAGIGWSDVSAIELNKAFAAQSLACIEAWKVDPENVNRHDGARAISHPLGPSDARILGTLARSLPQSRERWRVSVICIGVRHGLAVVLENVAD